MEKIVFCDGSAIKLVENGEIKSFDSEYIERYRKNVASESERHRWKNEGYSARFQGAGMAYDRKPNEKITATVQSAVFCGEHEICYSVTVNQMSGIFKKSLSDSESREDHVIHAQDLAFYDLSYSESERKVAVSEADSDFSRNISIYRLDDTPSSQLTSGDSKESNPFWSATKPGVLLFDSAGIGRDDDMNFVEYGPVGLYEIDMVTHEINTLKEAEDMSFVQPKDDAAGNLYYIERPVKTKKKRQNIFLQILMIPVRLIMAIVGFFEFFTMLFTGKGFSDDSDPSSRMERTRGKNKKPQEIFIDGNLIDADKNYRENCKSKEEFAGIAPRSWKLIKQSPTGERTVIKEGVIGYDITPSGDIVYTNGKNLVLLSAGKETRLAQATLCTRLSVCGHATPKAKDIFS